MKISELIKELEKVERAHGDVECLIEVMSDDAVCLLPVDDGGLFSLHNLEVITENGKVQPVFEVATPKEVAAHTPKEETKPTKTE
jgi:hypothetical protein